MAVTIKDVEHVAILARLGLTPEEKKMFAEQLNRTLEYAQIIASLDTENVAPTTHPLPMKNVFRDDKAKPWAKKEALEHVKYPPYGYFRDDCRVVHLIVADIK